MVCDEPCHTPNMADAKPPMVYMTFTLNPSLGGPEVCVFSDRRRAESFAQSQSERYFPTDVWEAEVDGVEAEVVWHFKDAFDDDVWEHRTGRRLCDGSWEPEPYSSWSDANPDDDE